jgi:hypothetical protein
MVHKVYKELMILGFIQFIFILLKDFGVVHPTQSYTHCFDFSLLLVTFTIFLYVFNMVREAPLAAVPQAVPTTHAFAWGRARASVGGKQLRDAYHQALLGSHGDENDSRHHPRAEGKPAGG